MPTSRSSERDAVQSLAVYAAPDDGETIPTPPDAVTGRLVSYDEAAGRATFKLVGLNADTYYAAVVEIRDVGDVPAWSSRAAFLTPPAPTPALVHTQAVTAVRNTRVMMHAYIESVGNSYILEQGFIYSDTNSNPGRDDPDATVVNVPITSQSNGTTISGLADNLAPFRLYWFRAFVRNNVGVTYGGVVAFWTASDPAVNTLATRKRKRRRQSSSMAT
jgi:hypothetical protein